MIRKAFRTGNSVVVSLPPDALEYLDIHEGTQLEVYLDREQHLVTLKPLEAPARIPGVDEAFAHQVAEFITEYRLALEELAK